MALASWWRGDPLPHMVPLPGFHTEVSRNEPLVDGRTAVSAERK